MIREGAPFFFRNAKPGGVDLGGGTSGIYVKLISKQVSVLLQIQGIRAIQYLRLIVSRPCGNSSGGSMRALAGNSGPVTVPRILHGATVTFGLLRIRLVFPISLRVIT